MDENRIEEIETNGGPTAFRKPYRTPCKLRALGGIGELVQAGVGTSSDANDGHFTNLS